MTSDSDDDNDDEEQPSEFILKFRKELADVADYIQAKYPSTKTISTTDLMIQYCAFSKAASIMNTLLEKKGVSKQIIDDLNMIMYEWEQESKIFLLRK